MSHSFYYNLKYFQVVSLDGRIIWDYSAYQHQLGIKTVRWSPDGKILALSSHDNKVRLFCSQFWSLIQEIDHPAVLHEGDPVTTRALVYSEESLEPGDIDAKIALEMVGGVLVQQSKYQALQERPVYLDFSRPDPSKSGGGGGGFKVGVGLSEWSSCGRYLASRCDNLPTTVWVWDIPSLSLAALLVQTSPVRSLAWDPALPRLALVTGQSSLHLWTPLGALISRVPQVLRNILFLVAKSLKVRPSFCQSLSLVELLNSCTHIGREIHTFSMKYFHVMFLIFFMKYF